MTIKEKIEVYYVSILPVDNKHGIRKPVAFLRSK
jgi:hypothetical protein